MSRAPTKTAVPSEQENQWIATIERWRTSAQMTKWDKACEVIRRQYRYEQSTTTKTRRYQMLWSNTQTMQGATYVKPPKAEVQRRYRDKDDTARQATQMVERCINYTFDAENYDEKFKQVRDDFLLYARGVARVVYEPVMEAVELPDDGLDGSDLLGPAGEQADLDAEAESEGEEPAQEFLSFERCKLKYIQREDFAHSPARVWDEVQQVAFRSFLDRDELKARFTGEAEGTGKTLGELIPLDAKSEAGEGDNARERDADNPKATIWEIWDKAKNRVLWVAAGWPDVLEESEPYLKFSDFFPCPRPAYGTLTNDTLAPRPDYTFYQDQAEEINILTARISSLQESLKLVGFYPAGPSGEGFPEIERAVAPGVENKMIAVKNWGQFAESGKGGAPIVWLPIEQVGEVLKGCVELRKQLIEDVNQIYGITDIMRGQGDAGETATAQSLKSQGGSLRIRTRQAELSRFCRDITRLVGEVICNHFQPETIMEMSNMPLPTDADVLAQIQQQQMMAQQQAAMQAQQQAQQAAMMGHNGGPPMGAAPQAPQGAQPPMGAMQ